ncbi:MAG: FHA domain-containing serine/threonine-protein kinase [Planctomycetaceae bacterium]
MFRLEQHIGEPLLLPPDLSVLIGRGDQCDLQLNDPAASRVHCRIIAKDGKVTLTDVGSRWGTQVNGQQVAQCDLVVGDRITIGETVLRLVVEGHPGQTTLASRSALQRPDQALIPRRSKYASQRILQSDEFLGQTFHRYRTIQLIASSSSGLVFKAKEEATGQVVALKIFQPNYFPDEQAEQRSERAVRTTVGQKHFNIVELFNAGQWNGYFFTASQFVEGESAVDLIRRSGVAGMLAPATVLQIALDLCEAFKFLEANSIVHRNILPSNILISKDHRTALLNDVIIAKTIVSMGSAQLTQAGAFLGDVGFMSPEMLGNGYPMDCRSDIYQLGVTLYALLTGKRPFDAGTISETITCVLTAEPKSIRDYHMATPLQFDSVVRKMLSKNPRDRFQNASELSLALKSVAAELGQQNIKSCEVDPRATGWRATPDGL